MRAPKDSEKEGVQTPILLLFLTLGPWASAQAQDNCETARQQICAEKPSDPSRPLINSAIINSEINIGPLTGEPKIDPEKRKLAIARKSIEEHMAKIGITQKNVLDKLSEVKRITAENYSQGRMGPNMYEQGPFSNTQLGKRISEISIITPFSDSKFLENAEIK